MSAQKPFGKPRRAVCRCLNDIRQTFLDTRITETILGPAIAVGLDALKAAGRSGKLFIFHTNLPTVEAPGRLKNREERKLLGTDKEKARQQKKLRAFRVKRTPFRRCSQKRPTTTRISASSASKAAFASTFFSSRMHTSISRRSRLLLSSQAAAFTSINTLT